MPLAVTAPAPSSTSTDEFVVVAPNDARLDAPIPGWLPQVTPVSLHALPVAETEPPSRLPSVENSRSLTLVGVPDRPETSNFRYER